MGSAWDILSRFASARLLIIGDSTTRVLARDIMLLLLGCSEIPARAYSLEPWRGVGLVRQSDVHAAKCEELAAIDRGQDSWVDFNISVPVGSTGETLEVRFHWLQWPSQLRSKWWWEDTVRSGDPAPSTPLCSTATTFG